MRIIAIDHGNARAGCAICDPSETITRPLGVVEPPDPAAVARLASAEEAELIVVGLPVSLDGSEGEQAATARALRRGSLRRHGDPGRDLRRAADDTARRAEHACRRQRATGRARRGAPARVLSPRPGGISVTNGADWHDPFADDEEAQERERRRAEREARRRAEQESLGEKVSESQAPPPAPPTPPAEEPTPPREPPPPAADPTPPTEVAPPVQPPPTEAPPRRAAADRDPAGGAAPGHRRGAGRPSAYRRTRRRHRRGRASTAGCRRAATTPPAASSSSAA